VHQPSVAIANFLIYSFILYIFNYANSSITSQLNIHSLAIHNLFSFTYIDSFRRYFFFSKVTANEQYNKAIHPKEAVT